MLMRKRVKYRRQHRGCMKGKAKGGVEVHLVITVYKQLKALGSQDPN